MHLFLFLFFVIICASGKFFDFLFIEYNCVGPLVVSLWNSSFRITLYFLIYVV